MSLSKATHVWVRGLVAALVSGASTGIAAMLAVPEAVSLEAPIALLKVCVIGAVVGVAGYLKQSPLPPEDGAS